MSQETHTREIRESARELKFLVTRTLAAEILEWARPRLAPDPYASGGSGDEYLTSSLYFDTEDLAVYQRRGSYRRSKYRIRRYGSSDIVFLERKLRNSTLLNKRRTTVPLAELDRLDGPPDRLWNGYWFQQRILARRVRPMCQVSYVRHARVGTNAYGTLRLTVDDQVRTAKADGLRFAPGVDTHVLDTHSILEMKFRVSMPAVFRQIVELFTLETKSVSKYRLAVEALEQTGVRLGPGLTPQTPASPVPEH